VFFGSGAFGVEPLLRLAGLDEVELVGVVTAPPRPAGRKREPRPTAVDSAARQLGVQNVLRPERLRDPEAVSSVLGVDPTLAVLADYGLIVPPPILGLRHGALNLHPSLLPRHRGASPIAAAILAGDRETGVTLFRMDAGLDSGPIVATARLALDGTEVAPELEAALAEVAADLVAEALPAWLRGELSPTNQDDTQATMTRPLRRADGRLDPEKAAIDLERQVRAYQPWPGSFLDTPAGRLVVWRADVVRGDPNGAAVPPGRLVGHERGLALTTATDRLVLLEVQPAGGRRMTGQEFVRGRPSIVGSGPT
jgi:methionyl-tRNA formyltransferase